MLGSDPGKWELDDLYAVPKPERKYYAEALRMVPFDLQLLAADGSGRDVVAAVGEQFALRGAIVHVDLDDVAARFIAPDENSFLAAARGIRKPRACWHWLNELVAEEIGSGQPDYRTMELAVGLSRKRGVASSLLLSMRREISKSFLAACLAAPYQEITERALEEVVRRRIPGLGVLIGKFGQDPRSNIASAALRYLREVAGDKSN